MKKFFISSTFKDMHTERDLIQNIVQPAINTELNTQGEYVAFSDLRWGIETLNDETKRIILDSCFDEIDRCKPYFIAFIGGTYGSAPKEETIILYKSKFDGVDTSNKSFTELEILYALKNNLGKLNQSLFYIKDDVAFVSKKEEKSINSLIRNLQMLCPSQIRHYKEPKDSISKDAFCKQLINDIIKIIKRDNPLSWYERVSNQMSVQFDIALPNLTTQWLNNLKTGNIDLAVLQYPECKVKESLIINFITQIQGKQQRNIFNRLFKKSHIVEKYIYLNVGATNIINTTKELLKFLLYGLFDITKDEMPCIDSCNEVKLRALLTEALTNFAQKGGIIYIIVSEYDTLIDANIIKWLPDYIQNVKWIISLSDKDLANKFTFTTHTSAIYGHWHLNGISCEKQIKAYEKWSHKTINNDVKNAIYELPYTNDYIILEMLFNHFMHFDGIDIPNGNTKEIPLLMKKYIDDAPNNAKNAASIIQYYLVSDFAKFDKKLCEFIFVCMAFLKRGLSITDMEKIATKCGLTWSELDIIRILNYESIILTQYEDGRYAITSRVIRMNLANQYSNKFEFDYSHTIFEYLKELQDTAPIKVDNYWQLCFITNHFRDYLYFLKSLYEKRIDNANIKTAFLPLFSNSEAVQWLLTSIEKGCLEFDSTELINELISIVASTYSNDRPKLTESFIKATQHIKDTSGDLTTRFRQHYTLALVKIHQHDYKGYLTHFKTCLELSKKQYSENPPQLKYLTEDNKYGIGTLQDFLANEFQFAYVEDIAALMRKYDVLPTEFQNSEDAVNYATTASNIRTRLSEISYIFPKDIAKIKNDIAVERKTPSLLRGKAIELGKQSDKEDDVTKKIKLLEESIAILNEILEMSDDDLVGEFKDSQKVMEYETTIYNECHRDLALNYKRLSEITDGYAKYEFLDKACQQIIIYAKERHNGQALRDIVRITFSMIQLSSEYCDDDKCLEYCILHYISFAETTPRDSNLSFEERLLLVFPEERVHNEIKRITTHNKVLRAKWIQDCKNQINTFQSLGNIDAMIWMIDGLNISLSYYVHELNIQEYISEHIFTMELMLQNLEKYLHIGTINMIHADAKKCLNKTLSEEDCINVLHIENMYSKYMLQHGEFDNSLNASTTVIDYCNKLNSKSGNITKIEFEALQLNSNTYLELNEIGKAWANIDKITFLAETFYEQKHDIDSIINLTNSKLNQVILWDKMSVETGLRIIEQHQDYFALEQLYNVYMLCENFKGKNEQLCKLMRRIRQSYEIIQKKGLGYLATPETLNLVKHYKTMFNDALQAEKEDKHDECIKKFKQLVIGLRNTHLVDIYFEADWYASILFTLGKNAQSNGMLEESEDYYKEAIQIRYELDEAKIEQNNENYALLLYYYSLVFLNKPTTTETINTSLNLLIKSEKLFKELNNTLNTDSLSSYASCCYNLGNIVCTFTNGGNKVGLPLIESAINITNRLINNYGLDKHRKDLTFFMERYYALKKGL